MFDLKGKTLLVTGASKGIGAAIATALGEAGARVIAHYGGGSGLLFAEIYLALGA